MVQSRCPRIFLSTVSSPSHLHLFTMAPKIDPNEIKVIILPHSHIHALRICSRRMVLLHRSSTTSNPSLRDKDQQQHQRIMALFQHFSRPKVHRHSQTLRHFGLHDHGRLHSRLPSCAVKMILYKCLDKIGLNLEHSNISYLP